MNEKHYILKADGVRGILRAQQEILDASPGFSFALKRYFLSSPEQMRELPPESGAVSYIIQPPLDGSAIALWLYLTDIPTLHNGNTTTASEDGRQFFWSACRRAGVPHSDIQESDAQTSKILEDYESDLLEEGMSIGGNCVRTWFFVSDIDRNYEGLVRARRENFASVGLTPETHFIASTGIAGDSPFPGALVQMDSYAIRGDFRQSYLYAPSHLNPTHEYGVTFERGVSLSLGSHRQILISGTASIDNRGRVLHKGDVVRQTERMFENVTALLSEAGSGWDDVKMVITYLRNETDRDKVAPLLEDKFKGIPYILVLAPVCRPDWLIEMECIAVK